MRSWKTPALLATVGLCGLGSLFAQGPLLPSPSDPTLVNGPTLSIESSPMVETPAPTSFDTNSFAPTPIEELHSPIMTDSPMFGGSPVIGEQILHESVPSASCESCVSPAPATECCAASASVNEYSESPVVMHQPHVDFAPSVAQPSCGCQGGSSMRYGHSDSPAMIQGAVYRQGSSHGYQMGSGSGVSSGILSPNANSGGLHTRYPYYNYRHPWFYQGPPSQNVTIVW